MTDFMTQVADGIYAIDTDYVRPKMDASHLLVDNGRGAFVDTGTTHSVPRLLRAMDELELDVGAVDYIFLTHIHLDHAGGAGALARALPNARVVIHPRGARHMADPSKLIAGTIAVYGEASYRRLYGELLPIAADRIIESADDSVMEVGHRSLRLIDTPGHALHHYSLVDEVSKIAFTGDTFGVSYRETDTADGAFIFPTTTPVHFDPGQLHASVDRIMSYEPQACLLTHYSLVRDTPRLADDLHRGIDAYVDMAQRNAGVAGCGDAIRNEMFSYLSGRLDQHGFEGDAAMRHAVLDMDIDLNVQGLQVWLKRMAKQAS